MDNVNNPLAILIMCDNTCISIVGKYELDHNDKIFVSFRFHSLEMDKTRQGHQWEELGPNSRKRYQTFRKNEYILQRMRYPS